MGRGFAVVAASSQAKYGTLSGVSNSDALVNLLTPISDVTNQPTLRPGRWYDASPTLSFALKCLMLASLKTREDIITRLERIVPIAPNKNGVTMGTTIARATDDGLSHFWHVVNGLKYLPEGQRQHAADFILSQLD
jgi:hypothetical protein